MEWILAHISSRSKARDPFDGAVAVYLDRCKAVARTRAEVFKSEAALVDFLERSSGRTRMAAVLLDARGRSLTSEGFADWLQARRVEGTQSILFGVGPPDGWTSDSHRRASLLLSLGPFTLAHTIARVVLAEQLYRATTILTGHPYHSGH